MNLHTIRSIASCLALVVLSACGGSGGGGAGVSANPVNLNCTGAVPTTHQVTVNTDGSFSPATVDICDGDTVAWQFSDPPHDTVIPVAAGDSANCATPAAFADGAPNNFVGPMPVVASGVFTLSPLSSGSTVETWSSPNTVGVFIRLLWKDVQLAPGSDDASFDFTVLDREIDEAVRHGKLYSLAIKAGDDGTPDWIFDTNANDSPRGNGGGVERLHLRDKGSDADAGCGAPMDLGTPTDPEYQGHYFDLLRKVAAHIKSRGDWYRALAYIKPSGANLYSHENRLPKRCDAGCTCNTRILAEAGYTPSGLYEFYSLQNALLANEFPGKTLGYALIQDGFPRISDSGDYETEAGTSSGASALPAGTEQTEHIIAQGILDHGARFLVSHNGLGQNPGDCPNEGEHPVTPPFGSATSGCPNRWVLEAGAQGQPTGFQTRNTSKVTTPADLESAFQNLFDNSDGIYLEIYQELLQSGENQSGGVLDPAASGRTIAQWSDVLHTRRVSMFPELGNPFPRTYRYTFVRTVSSGKQELRYIHGSKCASGGQGLVVIHDKIM